MRAGRALRLGALFLLIAGATYAWFAGLVPDFWLRPAGHPGPPTPTVALEARGNPEERPLGPSRAAPFPTAFVAGVPHPGILRTKAPAASPTPAFAPLLPEPVAPPPVPQPNPNQPCVYHNFVLAVKTGAETMNSRLQMMQDVWLWPGPWCNVVALTERFPANDSLLGIAPGEDEKYVRTLGWMTVIDVVTKRTTAGETAGDAAPVLRKAGGTEQGWADDQDKFLPGFAELWRRFPGVHWFLMIDDDTYLHMPTLVHLLPMSSFADPDKPTYLGSQHWYSGCPDSKRPKREGEENDSGGFSVGGGGILLSRAALRKMLVIVRGCIEDLAGCWAGDVRTSICLRRAGVDLSAMDNAGEGGFWADWSENVARWPQGSPCDPLITIHHVVDRSQLERLGDLGRAVPLDRMFTMAAAYPAVQRDSDREAMAVEEGTVRRHAMRRGFAISSGPPSAASKNLGAGKLRVLLSNGTLPLGAEDLAGLAARGIDASSALACHAACVANTRCSTWNLSPDQTCVLMAALGRPVGANGIPDPNADPPSDPGTEASKEEWEGGWTGMLPSAQHRPRLCWRHSVLTLLFPILTMARLSLLFVAIAALLGCLAAPVAGQAFVTIIGYGTPNCTDEGSSCNRSAWGSQQAVRSGLCTPTDLAPGAFTLSNCNGTDGLITVFSDSNCSTPLPVVPPISVGSGCTNVLGLFSITGGCLKINSTVITTTTTRPASAGRVGVGAMGALAAAVVGMITLF
ncbi:hypothetical protein DFJ74DRAFT_773033 [Hyaloraphidium curvatum]|nr:hypothetical protein DFJ74DRAFT_773033 [Hyaloraphidium curvatum]